MEDSENRSNRSIPPVSEHALNPAGRLFLFLTHLNAVPAGANMINLIAAYANVDSRDLPRVYSTAGSIALLPREVTNSIEEHPKWPGARGVEIEMERIDRAFQWGSVLQGNVDGFRAHYDNGAIRSLETWSETLNQHQAASAPEAPAAIDEVRVALDDLAEQLRSYDSLDPRVRSALLRHVGALRTGVDQFYIGGVDALVEELNRLFGECVLDPRIREEVRNAPSVWDRIVRVATAIGAVATVVHAAATMSTDIPELLQIAPATTVILAPGAGDNGSTDNT